MNCKVSFFFLPKKSTWTGGKLRRKILRKFNINYKLIININYYIKINYIINLILNIKARVTEAVDPWIIAIAPKNQLPLVWKNHAPKYRGIIFFGKLLEENLNEKMREKFKYTGKPKLLAFRWSKAKKTEYWQGDDLVKASY